MQCPLCGKQAKTARGLIKHLIGGARYGGHELDEKSALVQGTTVSEVELPDEDSKVDASAKVTTSTEVPASTKAGFLYVALTRVVGNKDLPRYQFERVIDAFLASFLPGILESLDGVESISWLKSFRLRNPRVTRARIWITSHTGTTNRNVGDHGSFSSSRLIRDRSECFRTTSIPNGQPVPTP